MARKVYVAVTARFALDGTVAPLSIQWEDGREFLVDRVLDSRRAANQKAGGIGMRYLCRIQNKEAYLYYEDPRWFVQGKE